MPDIENTEKYGGSIGNSRLAKAGDIVIEKISMTSYTGFTMNIRGQLKGLTIFEDIYSNTLTGQLVLNDTMAIAKHFPIVGNERIDVVFYMPGDKSGNKPIELTFRVFSASGSTKTSTENARFLVLEMASEEHIRGTTFRFSRSFKSMPYSEMITRIMREQVVTTDKSVGLNITPTIGKKNIVVPYWTPFYTINWITQRSIAKDDFDYCDFLFYQTLNGTYNFGPLSRMKTLPVTAKYTYVPGGKRTDTGDLPIADYHKNILSFSVVGMHNKVKSIGTGVYASSMITVDTTTKKYRRSVYNYRDQFGKEASISEFPIVSFPNDNLDEYASSMIKMYPKHSFQYNRHPVNDNVEQYALRRQAQLNRISTQSLRLEVPGDSRIRVGDLIDVEIPAFEETKNKTEYKDTLLSGKYMITAIKHVIMDDEYTMDMVVSKDSYDYQIPDSKDTTLKA